MTKIMGRFPVIERLITVLNRRKQRSEDVGNKEESTCFDGIHGELRWSEMMLIYSKFISVALTFVAFSVLSSGPDSSHH